MSSTGGADQPGADAFSGVAGGERALRERALAAMANAYAPNSSFRVGAALLAADGTISSGCNVENASFPAGICAERAALAAAISDGRRSFVSLVIATEAAEPTSPCGVCRQALFEFAPALEVLSFTSDGRQARWNLASLLPEAFGPRALGR